MYIIFELTKIKIFFFNTYCEPPNLVMKLAIKSNNIFVDSQSPRISGYILIEGDYIQELLPMSSLSSTPERDLSTYEILDYSNFYVMPGLIDLNIHLNSAFHHEWQDFEGITKQALTGGVTTIIDNPLMNHKEGEELDEIANIQVRKNTLEGQVSTDVGLLAYLGAQNYNEFNKIYEETGVLGFKLYMSQPFEENLSPFDFRELTHFSQLIKKSKLEDLVLSINCEMASNRDLFMASPCRKCQKEKRLDLKYNIHNFSGFGGGHHGVFQDEDEDEEEQSRKKTKSLGQKTQQTTDDSLFDIINEINVLESASSKEKDTISPSTALLNLNSKLMSNILEQKHISDLELLDYEESCYTGKDETKEISPKNQFDFQDLDSNLERTDEDSLNNIDISPKLDEAPNKPQNSEANFLLIQTQPHLKEVMQPKRFDSCPFFKPSDFSLKGTFEEAFEEIKRIENSEDQQTNSDNSNENLSSGKRSFGDRRRSFIQQKGKFENTPSKFSIKTKTTLIQQKEMQKNRSYVYFLPNHPVSWEINGLNVVLRLFSDMTNGKIILTNLSSPCLGFMVRENRKIMTNLNIYTDTSAPFMFFNKENVKHGDTKMKSSPPIRDKENQFFLIRSMKALIFDTVSSYHFSIPPKYKYVDNGNFRRAFNGISSIGGVLSMVWTRLYSILRIKQKKNCLEIVNQEEIEKSIRKLIYLMSENPSKIFFLDKQKGSLKKGLLADLVIWNPFEIKKITKNQNEEMFLQHKELFCLNGMKVYGEVLMTILRGEIVFKRDKKLIFKEKKGKLLFNKYWSHK